MPGNIAYAIPRVSFMKLKIIQVVGMKVPTDLGDCHTLPGSQASGWESRQGLEFSLRSSNTRYLPCEQSASLFGCICQESSNFYQRAEFLCKKRSRLLFISWRNGNTAQNVSHRSKHSPDGACAWVCRYDSWVRCFSLDPHHFLEFTNVHVRENVSL